MDQLENLVLENHYLVECYDSSGKLKWSDEFDNLITTEGLNDNLDKYLKGSAYTAGWYVGLTDGTPTVAAGDTMSSHAGWTEIVAYTEATREVLTLGTVSAGSVNNSASKASYAINGTTTIGGAFICSVSTKSGTTGTLYGVGAFSGGDRAMSSGDTLNVTVTATAASA